MVKLGVNSVLFKTVDFPTAAKAIKAAGYDGVEISAIGGMCEHLCLDTWRADKAMLLGAVEENELPFLSTEMATHDRERLLRGFEACAELGIPIVNIGPGGQMNDEDSVKAMLAEIEGLCEDAEGFGVTLCVKAHVGGAIWNTPTTLRMMEEVRSPAFGVDMDPSHIWRAGENPEDALPAVISKVKHIHIRDCKGRQQSPGSPANQACGRGDIDLYGYCKAMTDVGYNGPVCLEVIGPDQDIVSASIIAAETRGYLNAIFKMLAAGR